MNRTTRTAIKIILIAGATVACIGSAYWLGSSLTGHTLATSSGNMNYSRWQEIYFVLTRATGLLNGLCAMSWFFAARFFFAVDDVTSAGKRIFWTGLLTASLAISLGVPHAYAPLLGIKLNGIIFALYAGIFTGVGYWLLTIFTTPLAFKYTPLGAQLFGRRRT